MRQTLSSLRRGPRGKQRIVPCAYPLHSSLAEATTSVSSEHKLLAIRHVEHSAENIGGVSDELPQRANMLQPIARLAADVQVVAMASLVTSGAAGHWPLATAAKTANTAIVAYILRKAILSQLTLVAVLVRCGVATLLVRGRFYDAILILVILGNQALLLCTTPDDAQWLS